MTAATATTSLISNSEASPVVMNSTLVTGGRVRSIMGTVSKTADNPNYLALCRLQADWAVTKILIFCEALSGANSVEVGLYTGTVSSNMTAASASCYGSAVDISAGSTTGFDVTFETRTLDKIGQKVYQDAGDAAGDFDSYFLVIEPNGTATGIISFIVEYVDGT